MFNTNEKIICPICKKDLPKDSEFCQYCGHKIPIVNEMPPVDDEIVPNNEGKNRATEDFEAEIPVNYTMDAKCHYETDDDFGLTPDKPIYTMGIGEQEKYLQKLRTDKGQKIKYVRRGSMLINGIDGAVDVYEIYLTSGKWYKTIYLNMYGTYNAMFAPKGFSMPMISPKESKKKKEKRRLRLKDMKRSHKAILVSIIFFLVVGSVFATTAIYYNSVYNVLSREMRFVDAENYKDIENVIKRLPDDYRNVEEIKTQYEQIKYNISTIESLQNNGIMSVEKSEKMRTAYETLYDLDQQYANWSLNSYLRETLESSYIDFYLGKYWALGDYFYFCWTQLDGEETLYTNFPNELNDNKIYNLEFEHSSISSYYSATSDSYLDRWKRARYKAIYFKYRNVQDYEDVVSCYRISNISYNGEWTIDLYCDSNEKTYTLK